MLVKWFFWVCDLFWWILVEKYLLLMVFLLVYFNENNVLKYDKFVMNFRWKIKNKKFIIFIII